MIIDTTFARELAADLLEINAVILRPNEPFTWASGWHSPIYCDNRLTLRQPHIRSKIASKFSEFITQEFPGIDVVRVPLPLAFHTQLGLLIRSTNPWPMCVPSLKVMEWVTR